MDREQQNDRPDSSEDPRIAPARHADLAALKPVWLEFVAYHHRLDSRFRLAPQEWPVIRDHFARSLNDDESVLLLARVGEQIVGYLYGFIFHNNPGYAPKRVGFIRDICVLQAFRRRGVAAGLVEAAETWFKLNGIAIIQLYAAHKNDAGLAAWQKLGYDHYVVGLWKDVGEDGETGQMA